MMKPDPAVPYCDDTLMILILYWQQYLIYCQYLTILAVTKFVRYWLELGSIVWYF